MTDDLQREVAAWLRPAIASISSEELEARVGAVQALAASGSNQDIVALAHGLQAPVAVAAVETALENSDATYVRGESATLLSCIAGASTMLVLRNGKSGVLTAQLVESAGFLGLVEKVPGMLAAAQSRLDSTSRRVRDRANFALPTIKRLSTEEEVPTADVIGAVNAAIKRTEDIGTILTRRMAQLDEEIDVMWWGRSSTSFSTDRRWADIDPTDRALIAALEMSALLQFVPPFMGAVSILDDVVDANESQIDLIAVGIAASGTPLADNGRGPLLPISTAAHDAREYDGDKKVIAGVLRKELIAGKAVAPLRDIARQIVREIQIGKSL